MKCWECVEKHGRDLEHHFEDMIRVTKNPEERLKYEEWIDRIREIRREAHMHAKDIATEPDIGTPKDKGEEVEFSKPIRVETGLLTARGEPMYKEIFHEKEECAPESFRLLQPNPTHFLTICCPKNKYDPEKGLCLVSTMAHTLEHIHEEQHKGCSVCEAMA